MSLDIYLYDDKMKKCICICNKCDNEHENEYYENLFYENITHNLGRMADACGAYQHLWRPEELDISKAHQLIDPLQKSLSELISNPFKYQEFNNKNGWGNYEWLVASITRYIEACEKYPNANITVCR